MTYKERVELASTYCELTSFCISMERILDQLNVQNLPYVDGWSEIDNIWNSLDEARTMSRKLLRILEKELEATNDGKN